MTAAAFLLTLNAVGLSSNLTIGDAFIALALLLLLGTRTSQRDLAIAVTETLLLAIALVVFGGLLGSFFAPSLGASVSGLGKVGFATIAVPVLFGFGDRASASYGSLPTQLLGGGGASVSNQARAETLHAAFYTFNRHSFTGHDIQTATQTHDIVLGVAATSGVFGLDDFGIATGISVRPLWSRYRFGATRWAGPGEALSIGTIAAVIGFFANGLVGNQLYDRYIWIVITAAVALGYDLRRARLSCSRRGPPREAVPADRSRSAAAPILG